MKPKEQTGTRQNSKKSSERKPVRQQQRKSKKRATRHYAQRPPRTAEELFARPRKFQDQWLSAVQVPAEVRESDLSLSQVLRQFGLSEKTVLRLVGSAFTKKRGRYQVKPMDHLLRVLPIPSKKGKGLREVETLDSREASLIGKYWSAVEKLITRGDSSALRNLPRKYVIDARGKRIRFLMDVDELIRQAHAGVLHFESLYGRRA